MNGIRRAWIWLASLLLLAAMPASGLPSASGQVYEPVILDVWPDGSIYVYILVNVSEAPQRVVLPVLGKPVLAMATEGEGLIPVDFNETSIWIDVPTPGVINVTYLTVSISYKQGAEWLVKYSSPWSTRILLPVDALLLGVNASRIIDVGYAQGHRAYLELGPGETSVEYVRLPSSTGTSTTTVAPGSTTTKSPAALTTTSTAAQTGFTASRPSATVPGGNTVGSTTLSTGGKAGGGFPGNMVLGAGIGAALVLMAALYAAHRRRERGEAVLFEELDERDKSILELVEKHGSLTASEISEHTGIPRSPLYRRLRRLVREGFLESRRISGKTVYSLREKQARSRGSG